MTTLTVTATQGGASGTANGMALRVMVITGALPVASQAGGSGGTQTAPGGSNVTVSVTTTQAGSRVYGACSPFTGTVSSSAAAGTTIIDNVLDATNSDNYVTFKGTSVTGTPGATSFGVTNTANAGAAGPAAYEVLAATTLAEDGSGPAVASTTTATTVTTGSFTPPPGSLLVALIASDGGTGTETMSVTDSLGAHLNWTEKAHNTTGAGNDYTGVWVADVPAAGGGAAQALPGQTWLRQFHHRQLLPPPAAAVAAAAAPFVPQPLQAPFRQRQGPHRGRLGRFGACAAGILAATTLSPQPAAVPPARPQPVIQHPVPHRAAAKGILVPALLPFTTAKLPPAAVSPRPPHRAVTRWYAAKTTLSAQPSSVPPARPRPPAYRPPGPHRGLQAALPGPAPAAVQAAGRVVTLQPVTAVSPRPPHRAVGKGILAATTLSPQPARVPPPQWRQPNAPRPAHRAIWRAVAGPAPAVVVVTGVPPSRPLPTVNRPPAPHRAVVRGALAKTTLSAQPAGVPPPGWRPLPRFIPPHRAAWRLITGPAPAVAQPALVVPARPRPVTNRPPAPHRALTRQLPAKTTLSAQPSRVPPPAWRQPNAPRPAHRAIWRAVGGPPPPPAPFTVGTLTASDAPAGVLGTVTASGGAGGVLTASDTRAGGPR